MVLLTGNFLQIKNKKFQPLTSKEDEQYAMHHIKVILHD